MLQSSSIVYPQVNLQSIERYTVTTASICSAPEIVRAEIRLLGSFVAPGDPLNLTLRRVNLNRDDGPFDTPLVLNASSLGTLQTINVTTAGLNVAIGETIAVSLIWDDDPTIAARLAVLQCGAASSAPVALLDDNISQDVNANSLPDPGDALTMTLEIVNGAGSTAASAGLAIDIGAELSLAAGSLRSTPVARDDVIHVVGNVGIQLAAPGVLSNDVDPDGRPGLQVVAASGSSLGGGEYSLNASGRLSYSPPPGFEGVDRLAYFIRDADGNTDQAVITLHVKDIVWFIDNQVQTNGDGRFATPFNSLGAFMAQQGGPSATDPKEGDRIYIHEGKGLYVGGINLLNGQQLLGQGVDLSIGGRVVTHAGVSPLVSNPVGTALTLARDNILRGFDIGATCATGIVGQDFDTCTMSQLNIRTESGPALLLSSGRLEATLATLACAASSSTAAALHNVAGQLSVVTTMILGPAADGLRISDCSVADFDFGQTTIDGAASDGLVLNNNSAATISFETLSITNANGRGILALNGGTLALAGTNNSIEAKGGAALALTNTSFGAGATFASVSSAGSSGPGLELIDLMGAINILDGEITNANLAAISISRGASDIYYHGHVNNQTGKSVAIDGRGGGTVYLGGFIVDRGDGIALTNNGAATLTFAGGFDLDVNGTAAFSATGGGFVNVTNAVADVTSANAPALVISGAARVGPLGVTLRSISSEGATTALILKGSGTGRFRVTGNSGARDGSGGIISNTAGDALSLSDAHNVTLCSMLIIDAGAVALRALNCSTIACCGIDIARPGKSGMELSDLRGRCTLRDSRIRDIPEVGGQENFGIAITNTSTDLSKLSVIDCEFVDSPDPDEIFFQLRCDGTSQMAVDVKGCRFENIRPEALNFSAGADGSSGGHLRSTIGGTTSAERNQFLNAASLGQGGNCNPTLLVLHGATHTTVIQNNLFDNVGSTGPFGNMSILRLQNNGGTLNAEVRDNEIRNINTIFGIDRHGIGYVCEPVVGTTGSADIVIENNDVDDIDDAQGIYIDLRDRADDSDIIIRGNRIGQRPGSVGTIGGSTEALYVTSRGDAKTVNLLVTSNTITATCNSDPVVQIRSRGGTDMNATVDDNSISNLGSTAAFQARTSTSAPSMCLDLIGNSAASTGPDYLIVEDAGTIEIEGPTFNTVTATDIQNAQTSGSASISGTVTFNNGQNCTEP